MANLTEGLETVRSKIVGKRDTLIFGRRSGDGHVDEFHPIQTSDGTLRLLGILIALCQPDYAPVVGIEEPELAVHPGTAESLMEALSEARHERQVLITTHSPDLLDYKRLKDEQIRVVNWADGTTTIAPLSPATRQTLRERLYTMGELLSVDELNEDFRHAKAAAEAVDLFGEPFETGGQAQ